MFRGRLQSLLRSPSTPACAYKQEDRSVVFSLRSKKVALLALTAFGVVAALSFVPELHFTVTHADDEDKHFAIFTKSCMVPDYDPWHPSVMPYVSTTRPISCSKDPPYSYTDRTRIFIDTSAMTMTANKTKAKPPITCCYRIVDRPSTVYNDSITTYKGPCVPVTNGTTIHVEFIRLTCLDAEGALVYANYHAFVIRKPRVEKRCARSLRRRARDGTNDSDFVSPVPKRGKFAYSVLLLGADSLSRNNMKRSHSQTVRYLEKRMRAVWLNGMNALGENTLENVVPLLTGRHIEEVKKECWRDSSQFWDNCSFLWTEFANAGYRTLYAEDQTVISTFNYLKSGFKKQPTDYYLRTLLHPFETNLGRYKLLNCYLCVGQSLVAEVVLNYTRDFAITFNDEPYFAFTWVNSLTHDYASTRWGGDEIFLNFFESLYEGGHLNRTIVVFLSDHGMRWGGIRRTFAGLLEGRMPGHLWYLPRSLTRSHPHLLHVLQENAHRLTTPLDVHATLRSVLEDFKLLDAPTTEPFLRETQRKYGGIRMTSLFTPVRMNRTCDDTGMEKQWCSCLRRTSISTSSRPVPQVAEAVVREINRILEPYSPRCARLSLLHVDSAYAHVIEDPRNSVSFAPSWTEWLFSGGGWGHTDVRELTVTLVTVPGEAVFEATARVFKGVVTVVGEVLRISLYGNSSHCVPNMPYRKFCYCLWPASSPPSE
ncbi:uncharacterized protein [Dermacentor albipictus]|uniref:uncharacterized protein n=1 Tax=Dermacentor albipictus TaxID=60249 RepID=UPI0031FBB0BC